MATEVLEHADEWAAGLSSEEARRRLAEQGPNPIPQAKGPPMVGRFLANFVQPLDSCCGPPRRSPAREGARAQRRDRPGHRRQRDLLVPRGVQAERAIQALQQMLPVQVHVRRDGEEVEIPTEQVVRGDVLVLGPGDRVAADADLLRATELRVDESALTGESVPVEPDEKVFASTYVTNGTAEAVVTNTGMETRFGRIAALSQRTERDRSPLELELDRVTNIVAALAVSIGVARRLVQPTEDGYSAL